MDLRVDTLDPAGGSRPAAVARGRALLAGGAWIGAYALAGAILDETYRAAGPGRAAGDRGLN